jgi:hypothetical protein
MFVLRGGEEETFWEGERGRERESLLPALPTFLPLSQEFSFSRLEPFCI